MKEIITSLNEASSRFGLRTKMLFEKHFITNRKRHLMHGGIYAVIFALLIGNCCPMVKVHAETVVEVTDFTGFKSAIENAENTTADSPLTIMVKGKVTLNDMPPISNKHIKIKSDGVGYITSTYKGYNIQVENGSLILENISFTFTGSKGLDYSSIVLNGNANLIMNEGSIITDSKRDNISVRGVGNTITMNTGSKLNPTNNAEGIVGGSFSLTMNTGSVIQGDGSNSLIEAEGSNNSITMNGGQLIDGLFGIHIEKPYNSKNDNNIINLNSGLISKNVRAGVFVDAGVGNTITMNEGMTISNNQESGVYIQENVTFTMNGGSISNNHNKYSSSGIMATGASNVYIKGGLIEGNTNEYEGAGIGTSGSVNIEMSGGTIRSNKSNLGTGGVYVYDDATFTMTGGTIESNEGIKAGGIYESSTRSTVNLFGGTITKNKGKEIGGVAINDDNMYLKGNVVVKDNTLLDGTTLSNIVFHSLHRRLKVAGALTGNIGVTLKENAVGKQFAKGNDYQITDTDANAFKSDTGLGIAIEENTLLLADAAKEVTFKKDLDDKLQVVKKDKTVTLEVETISKDKENLKYQWYVNDKASTENASKLDKETSEKLVLKNDKTGDFYYYVVVTNNKNHTEKTITSKLAPISVYEETENKGAISGNVTNEDVDASVEGVSLKIYYKNTLLGETTTDKHGDFVFHDLPYGTYNLVATKDTQTITVKVVINSELTTSNIKLPEGTKNTVVETVGETTPAIVVDGLNGIYDKTVLDNIKGITEKDLETLHNGGSIELRLKAERKKETDIQGNANKLKETALKDNKVIGLYIDLSLIKSITDSSLNTSNSNLEEVMNPLEITLEIPEDMRTKKNLQVYRIHNGKVDKISSKDSEEEYFTINENKVVIHTKKFSVYALGFDKVVEPEKPTEPDDPTTPSDPTEPTKPIEPIEPTKPGEDDKKPSGNSGIITGDVTSIAGSSFAMMSSMGVMAVAYQKMKKQYEDNHEYDCFHGFRNKLKFARFLLHQAIKDITMYVRNRIFKK